MNEGSMPQCASEINDGSLPLVVSFIARSGTGKTSFIEKLVPELKRHGLRVGVLKHHAHPVPFDVPGKDTYRLSQAGADVVVGACSVQTAVFIAGDASADLDAVIDTFLRNVDLVLTEGYKRGAYPKIEVHRAARAALEGAAATVLCAPEELIGVVTDEPLPLPASIPRFGLDDHAGVADLLAGMVAGYQSRRQPS